MCIKEFCFIYYYFSQGQKADPNLSWNLSEDFRLSVEDVAGEVVVAGVYLRIFVTNPGNRCESIANHASSF